MKNNKIYLLPLFIILLSACSSLKTKEYSFHTGPVIIQISDLHIREKLDIYDNMVEIINTEKPEILFLTGDLIQTEEEIDLLLYYLNKLDPEIKKYAIKGNWDSSIRIDTDLYRKKLASAGVTLLVNEQVEVQYNQQKIFIFGLDESLTGAPNYSAFNPSENINNLNIIITHCPVDFDTLIERYADFQTPIYMLAGHSHGGQITFFGLPLQEHNGSGDYHRGKYSHNRLSLYVNKGIGTSRIHLRIFSSPEVTVYNKQ